MNNIGHFYPTIYLLKMMLVVPEWISAIALFVYKKFQRFYLRKFRHPVYWNAQKGFTVNSINCPANIFSPNSSDNIWKPRCGGVIVFKFSGDEKKSQALSRVVGNSCTFFKL